MTPKPVGLSRDLPSKRVMRANVDGQDVVVWRASDGSIAAWDNRCPHRGMSLSHGFVRGNALACLYHGWHYGATGQCSLIPAHPDLEPPATIHVRRHGVVERGGVIWVAVDAESVAEATHLDPLRSLIVQAPEPSIRRACLATLLDATPPRERDGLYHWGKEALAVLCNPMGEATQLTVLVTPGLPAARQRALSRWCEAMRRRAETGSDA